MANKTRQVQLEEKLQVVDELIRKVFNAMYPEEDHAARLRWFTQKNNLFSLMDKFPKCIYVVNIGRQMLFPICNRQGVHDPRVIRFSLDLARKLSQKGKDWVDGDKLNMIISKLERLERRYSQDIPKPADMAQKKAASTKIINKIKIVTNQNKR